MLAMSSSRKAPSREEETSATSCKGAGFAASFARIGACTTAFLFPILLADLGTAKLLYILVGTSLLGAAITWLFRIETAGVNLEEIGTEGDRGSSTDPSLVFTPRS